MTETVRATLARVEAQLAVAGCDTPRVDAELLLSHVLGTSRSGLLADGGRVVSPAEAVVFEGLVARR